MNVNWSNVRDILTTVLVSAGLGKIAWEIFFKPFVEKLISHRFNSLLQKEKNELDQQLETKKVELLQELEAKKTQLAKELKNLELSLETKLEEYKRKFLEHFTELLDLAEILPQSIGEARAICREVCYLRKYDLKLEEQLYSAIREIEKILDSYGGRSDISDVVQESFFQMSHDLKEVMLSFLRVYSDMGKSSDNTAALESLDKLQNEIEYKRKKILPLIREWSRNLNLTKKA